MQAIHAPLIRQSGITHVLALSRFSSQECPSIVVAGGQRVRVYEVAGKGLRRVYDQVWGGEVEGLARVKGEGGERVVVGFGGKLALLEWMHGEISTVSLHTFERAPQVLYANPEDFVSILRTDPNSKLIVQLLPNDALAMIPLVQDFEEFEGLDHSSARDVPYMPSFILSLPDLSPTLRNVKDLVFLPGFNNPTLAILFQPLPTATGRSSSPRDTFHLEIRTLDPLSQTYPLISSTVGLPYDAQYLVPCPHDIGGLLLVTATALIHIDQSGKFITTSTNGWFKFVSKLTPTQKREECLLELDGSHIVWAEQGNFLVLLRDGRVVQARLQVEGRSVVRIDLVALRGEESLEKELALEVGLNQPSSVCPVSWTDAEGSAQNGFFAAAAVGDSHLVSVRMVAEEQRQKHEPDAGKDEMDVDLDDDLYGDSVIRSELTMIDRQPLQAHLDVADTVPGIGYVSDMTFAVTPEDPLARQSGALPAPREAELAILQGCGRAPSMVNLIKPRLPLKRKRKYQELNGSSRVWAFTLDVPSEEADQPSDKVSRLVQVTSADAEEPASTYLWAIDSATGELQEVLLTMEGETVSAGRCIGATCARVGPRSVSLLNSEGMSVQEYQLDAVEAEAKTDFIVDASVLEEIILLRLSSGNIRLLHLVQADDGIRFNVENVEMNTARPWTAAQLVSGASEPFAAWQTWSNAASERADPSQWLLLANRAGDLEIRCIPGMELVFRSNGLGNADQVLIDDGVENLSESHQMDTSGRVEKEEEPQDEIHVEQICLANIGEQGVSRPYLSVLYSSDTLVIYETQPRSGSVENGSRSLPVRFRKTSTKILGRPRIPRTLQSITLGNQHTLGLTGSHPLFVYEDRLDGLLCSNWTEPITSLAHLEVDGTHQLLMVANEAILFTLKAPDAQDTTRTRRKQLERTYTHLKYDTRSSHYVGASAISVPYQLYSDECELIPGPDAPNLTPALIERSNIELINPYTWTATDGYEFDENEVVLCMEYMTLEATSTEAGLKKFLLVGTSINRGEDMSSKGNTYVFEIVEVVGADDIRGEWRLRLICTEEGKGPVSALANIGKYIVQAMGQKIYVKALDKEDHLVPVAFLDVPPYITSLKTFKNLLLIGDMVKSVWLAVFQESPFKLDVIAKDFYDASIVSVDFLASEGSMTFSAADDQGDLRLLEFDTQHSSANEVAKLIRRTEYHLGQPTVKSLMVARRKTAEDRISPQTQILYADALGGISTLVPLKAARFKRLQLLQGQLTRSVQHAAGLNPKAFRHVANRYQARALNKGILDGFLLQTFIELPTNKQRDLVAPIGTNRETIINDLADLAFTW
ncbi:hypothetical protein NliqN6_0899 [Naganishia liquefaciens]|uniref:Cleavage/polyadenylation specificity factor A subunit C-terminal domain-containing protein n=1 Tax=Naganishia liquefaciens TaxID=104408 RepID=A0A8H3TNT4_9TREE|nr:hypothetical protein NliqN6_0899 [Naganishia liquefaciens]